MDTEKILMVTSCKGGVGKSTVAANLALTLARAGKRTLLVDCDFDMRCLDLMLGCQDRVVYDICDLVMRDVAPDKCLLQDPRNENFFFCAAPYRYRGGMDPLRFREVLHQTAKALQLDCIVLDTPGSLSEPVRIAACAARLALVVTTPDPTALRAAEHTNLVLRELGVPERRLLVNNYELWDVNRSIRTELFSAVDGTGLQLLGLIPADPAFPLAQEQGLLIDRVGTKDTRQAFSNLAGRICGGNIPLFWKFRRVNRNLLLR